MTLLALLACRPAGQPCAPGGRFSVDEVAVDLRGEGRALAVVVEGGFEADQVPPSRLLEGSVAQLHLDLPGGGQTPGARDRFGSGSRAALATALRYAAGEEVDDQGCTLPERLVEVESVVLAAFSNGGNLAVATLADPALDLPTLAGLVTWETPAGPQFVLQELVLPETGACALEPGLRCEVDLSHLRFDGQPYLDRDGDGAPGPDEPSFPGLSVDGRQLHSPTLAAALGERAEVLGVAASEAFFAERDASLLAGDVAARQPGLRVVVTGTEQDHMQVLEDSPHVVGLGQAFAEAGLWTRLNPPASLSGGPENAAGAGLDLEDPGALLPGPVDPGALLGWAVLEAAGLAP